MQGIRFMNYCNEFYGWYYSEGFRILALDFDEDIFCNIFNTNYEKCDQHYKIFTKWSPDVMDDNDGYVEDPTTVNINELNLSMEFHPGDTILFFKGNQIGSLGPHWSLPYFDETTLNNIRNSKYLDLLLPFLMKQDRKYLESLFPYICKHFDKNNCNINLLIGELKRLINEHTEES